ncbi:hypothetical protein K3495_g376 [Podosphaera aphanis]|nr:hypothetical protein K3495_g376 [Podosphaera aphanis]
MGFFFNSKCFNKVIKINSIDDDDDDDENDDDENDDDENDDDDVIKYNNNESHFEPKLKRHMVRSFNIRIFHYPGQLQLVINPKLGLRQPTSQTVSTIARILFGT